jgi:hypothetical protein
MFKTFLQQPSQTPILYIFMRRDLASMNPGKAMAQAAHAGNQFAALANFILEDYDFEVKNPDSDGSVVEFKKAWDAWTDESKRSFGTTIVLESDEDTIYYVIEEESAKEDTVAEEIWDDTYPIQDGRTIHHLPVMTCGYVFVYDKNTHGGFPNYDLHP